MLAIYLSKHERQVAGKYKGMRKNGQRRRRGGRGGIRMEQSIRGNITYFRNSFVIIYAREMYNYHVRDKRREKMFETELLETRRFIGNRCVDQAISAGRNETTGTTNIF